MKLRQRAITTTSIKAIANFCEVESFAEMKASCRKVRNDKLQQRRGSERVFLALTRMKLWEGECGHLPSLLGLPVGLKGSVHSPCS